MSMEVVACPTCLIALQAGDEQYVCPRCRRVYGCTLGIPSLCPPEVMMAPIEHELIQRLCAMYPTATVEELTRTRLAALVTSEDRLPHYAHYFGSMVERGHRFYQMFRERLRQQGWTNDRHHLALDVGCGSGSGLLALARDYDHVVGVEISLSALIIAKKAIENAGLTNVTLVHGSAHQMPLLDGAFDLAISINVLEHVFTPAVMLCDVRRTLTVSGTFCGESRNRFDVFFPEPHVGLRWVGFLPRRYMARYVRWRKGLEYQSVYLLSYGDLSRALHDAFGREWRIVLPDITVYGFPLWARSIVERLWTLTPLRWLMVRLSPSQLTLARRV